MKFLTFRRLEDARTRLGLHTDDGVTVLDLSSGHPDEPACASLDALVASGERGLDLAREAYRTTPARLLVAREEILLCPPLRPPALQDCGLIRTHLRPIRAEMCRWIQEHTDDGRSFEELTEWMSARTRSSGPLGYAPRDHRLLAAPDGVVRRPRSSSVMDYELELAVVIGSPGHAIDRANAGDHIFGYTIYNDWSLRDVQIRTLLAGGGDHGDSKDFPGSNVIGPCVVTKDELTDPYDLEMTVRVNGDVWGRGSSAQAWATFEDLVVRISADRPIAAGEVWGSGTVRNGSAFEVGRRLPPFAYVELEVEGIGTLANYVVPEGALDDG
ncbi:MAG TPA: fumarylacetoacetate hydrolase family protein [Ilumatobacter sp.]|nr:fumarylacetoacetate hydrolase family protein [Ilumatobacter sp.]